MTVPPRNDSTDHLLITAHLYWLTGGDGEGSKAIQYTERQPRVRIKTRKGQCVCENTEDRGRYLKGKKNPTQSSKSYFDSSTHTQREA